jgi:hypothetical protein
MGLFGLKKKQNGAAVKRPLRSIEMSAGVLQEAGLLLEAVESALGTTDARLRRAVRALALGAGALDIEEIVRAGLSSEERTGRGAGSREWRATPKRAGTTS